MSSHGVALSRKAAPLFLSSLRLPATLTSADRGWDGIALAVIPVLTRDSVSIPAPDWHFLNVAPLASDAVIEHVAFTCGDKKDSLARIEGARIQTLLPVGVSGKFAWEAATGGPLHIYLHNQWLVRAAEATGRDPTKVELTQNGFLNDPVLEHLSVALHQTYVSPGGCDCLFAETIANLLGIHLLRSLAVFPADIRMHKGGLASWRLRRVTEYIDENLGRQLSLQELASVSELSPYHFGRLFKQSTGFSPHRYVTRMRIDRAKQKLRERRLSLVEISAELGFSGQSHFTTVFHHVTGVTPKYYRNQ